MHHVIAGAAVQRVKAVVAKQRVIAAQTPQNVVAAKDQSAFVAVQDVGQRVSGAVDVVRPEKAQHFDVVAQRVADPSIDRVIARVQRLDHHVVRIIDLIKVIARATVQSVRAQTSIERVIPRKAPQHIATAVTDQRVAKGTAAEVFDVGKEITHSVATFGRAAGQADKDRCV